MNLRTGCAWSAAIAAGLGLCAQAGASQTGLSLGLNFGVTRGGGGPSPVTSEIPDGGFAGVPTAGQPAGLPGVDQTNWNDLFDASQDSGVGVANNLTLDRNNIAEASAARVSWRANGSSDPTGNNEFEDSVNGPPAPQNFELYQGYLDTDDNTTTRVNIRDLPAADFAGGYDVYIYFLGSSSARGGTYGVAPIFLPPAEDPNAIPTNTFQPNRLFNNQAGAWVSDPDLGDIFIPSGGEANGPNFTEDPGESFDDIGNFGVIRGLTALEFTLFATVIGDRTFGFGDRERAPISAVQLVTGPQWGTDADGGWTTAANWSGGVPNSVNAHARFFSTIGADRTVNVDAAVTTGVITFNNDNSYLLTGTSGITLDVNGGPAVLNVVNGSHSIAAPLILADNTLVTVAPATSTLTLSDLQPSAVNLDKAGDGTLAVNHVRAGSLAVAAGTVQILSNSTASGVSKVAGLAIADGAKLDLTDNKLITDEPAGTATDGVYDGVQGLVQSGYNGGAWNGDGITSSSAAAVPAGQASTAIGVATGAQVNSSLSAEGATALFAGQTITGSSVIAMYTYGGDANLDGLVSGDDYTAIDFAIAVPGASGWVNGDFNYDGIISGDDYTVIDFNVAAQGAPFPTAAGAGGGAATVPEPAALGVMASSAFLMARRRRRKGAAR